MFPQNLEPNSSRVCPPDASTDFCTSSSSYCNNSVLIVPLTPLQTCLTESGFVLSGLPQINKYERLVNEQLIITKGNIRTCLWSPSAKDCVYQLGSSPPMWIVPLLAWCWRYVLMKKGDDEEGERLHSWLPEESISAAYYYIKQLGGPYPSDCGSCFPHDDTVWWWLLTPAGCSVACLQWCHCTSPSGKLSWNVLRWIIRGWGENTSTEGGMVESPLIIIIINVLFIECHLKQMRPHEDVTLRWL